MTNWTTQLDTYMWELEIDTTVRCANLDCFCKVEIVDAIIVLEHSWVCSPECLWEWNNQEFVRSEFYD